MVQKDLLQGLSKDFKRRSEMEQNQFQVQRHTGASNNQSQPLPPILGSLNQALLKVSTVFNTDQYSSNQKDNKPHIQLYTYRERYRSRHSPMTPPAGKRPHRLNPRPDRDDISPPSECMERTTNVPTVTVPLVGKTTSKAISLFFILPLCNPPDYFPQS